MASTARVRREPLAGGGWAWRKTFGPTQRAAARSLLRIFAGWRNLPVLAAPAAQSAEQACATEYSMIGRLAALGARVPAILERGERELVLEDLGPTLSSALQSPQAEERHAALRAGFRALAALHAAGGHASQAFARNLTWDGQRVGFIDLEEDPGTVMPLVAAQARDLLLYVQSCARAFEGEEEQFRAALDEALALEPAPVRCEAQRTARALALPATLALRLGGDARRAALGLHWLAQA